MKTVNINKEKVNIFDEDDLINKLKLSQKDCDLVLEYQRTFPELLQNKGSKITSAKQLYFELGFADSQWSRWYKKNIINNSFFIQNKDWWVLDIVSTTSKGGIVGSDFTISLEFAKHLAMTAKTKKGHLIRNYFISLENSIRDYESWCVVREPQKKNYNYMIECLNNWCKVQGFDYADKVFRTRECNMINVALTGKTALELKSYIGFKDKLTREHLQTSVNKAIDELQILNSNLLIANMSFNQRKEIIENICKSKFDDLYKNKLNN